MTRAEYEAIEVKAFQAEQAFALAVRAYPALSRLFVTWKAADARLVEARREWRAEEVRRAE